MILYNMVVVIRDSVVVAIRPFELDERAEEWAEGVRLGIGLTERHPPIEVHVVPNNVDAEAAQKPEVRQAFVLEALKVEAEKLRANGWTIPNTCSHYYSHRLCGEDGEVCFTKAWGVG